MSYSRRSDVTAADVLVVGGGIVGSSIALAAADLGLRVILIDSEHSGAASIASAGMLAPSLPGLPPRASRAAREARDFYPRFLGDLREMTGIDTPLNRAGLLQVALDDEAWQSLRASAAPGDRLERRVLGSLEPALAHLAGAIFHALDGAVDNVILMRALADALSAHDRVTRVSEWVSSIDADKNFATARTNANIYCGEHLVLATGAWANEISGAPVLLPVQPLKGELLLLGHAPMGHVIYGPDGYLIPRGNDILVGATSQLAGFDATPTSHARDGLLRAAEVLCPTLAGASVRSHWGGLRPMTVDGLPIIRRDGRHPRLMYATGFSRNGILLAPFVAVHIARDLAGISDIASSEGQ